MTTYGQDNCPVRYAPAHRMTPPHEEQRLLGTAPSAGDATLLAEVVELRARNEQLTRALASRAQIDQALGMVMALARCSSGRAWDVLVEVSQHCNIKLRDVAAALVATTEDRSLPQPLRRELRQALRHLQAL
ncbi:ANTAR domain-containing protein [Streptomyces sviceus]|uniref:ANTAR domain-containing protein n=1 Tax=Streptomyces sviceus TaxID=285530 RepID=UPI00382725C7